MSSKPSSSSSEAKRVRRQGSSSQEDGHKMIFGRSRSAVLSTKWMVASSQPLASVAGSSILAKGGNACDAAIAIAAALAVTEPCSTGLGGDMFALFYDAKSKTVHGLNGSGRSASSATFQKVKETLGPNAHEIPRRHGLAVTVPGCVAGWADALEKWGTMSLKEVLEPAIKLASEGFPVSEVTAHWWARHEAELDANSCFLPPPKPYSIFRNPGLARTLTKIANEGKAGFYTGETADKICKAVQACGGLLQPSDLGSHETSFVEPLKLRYRNKVDVYECPPNGQGLAALMALETFQNFDPPTPENRLRAHNMHIMIECMRASFADAREYIADPKHMRVQPESLLFDDTYRKQRLAKVDPKQANKDPRATPLSSSDTVSFQVVDGQGNAMSVVNSTYEGFGSGICPEGLGLSLQNRGCNFSLNENSANRIDASKRPYHTIIPGMSLNSDDQTLHACFTVMGGFMQPQGHLQVMSNLVDLGDDPQRALDRPRFCVLAGEEAMNRVALEEGFDDEVVAALQAEFGHTVKVIQGYDRALFGRGQIILRNRDGTLIAGSDVRADGCAIPGL